ncbi:hypothetical protein AVEN_77615-1 [Araneus ventricosus]|uniref:Uncharacterized protein n=1 Tax=Araneus ventricosus TaxID=182803 RepID=A0A4Y2P319_ARAVE|nr:hypothetical protein AVEN_77615-1 [Araneus ventricosus]
MHAQNPPLKRKPLSAPVSLKGREPPPCICIARISAFMPRQSKWSGWISRRVGNPNFRPHRFISHRFFTLTGGFGVEQPNLREEECSLMSTLRVPRALNLFL